MRTLSANEMAAVAGGHWEDGADVVYFVDGPEGWYGVDAGNSGGNGEHATNPVSAEATGGILGGAAGTLICWELGPGSVLCGAAAAYGGSWIANNPQIANQASDATWREMSRQTRSTPFTK